MAVFVLRQTPRVRYASCVRNDMVRLVSFRARGEAELAASVLKGAGVHGIEVAERSSRELARELGVRSIGLDFCEVAACDAGRDDKPGLTISPSLEVDDATPVGGACQRQDPFFLVRRSIIVRAPRHASEDVLDRLERDFRLDMRDARDDHGA